MKAARDARSAAAVINAGSRRAACRDGVPLPWTADAGLSHGFSLGASAAADPWLPAPAGWGSHAIELQEQDPGSALNLTKAALELRRRLWKEKVFTTDDGGTWRVEDGNLLVCERNQHFLVAVAMGTEPVQLPAGTVLLSAAPLEQDGWLQPNNAEWVLRDSGPYLRRGQLAHGHRGPAHGEADVVLEAGASMSPFTRRLGHLFGPDSTVIQCVPANGPKRVPVHKTKMRHSGDAHQAAHERSLSMAWKKEADDDTQCRRRPPFYARRWCYPRRALGPRPPSEALRSCPR